MPDWGTDAFFRNKEGKAIAIGKGLARFSPDCKHFWFTGYGGGSISIHETESGRKISSFPGYYPKWALDANTIYFSRPSWDSHPYNERSEIKEKKYQLMSWSISEQKSNLIMEVDDFCACYPPCVDLLDWHPVTVESNGNIKWKYPTCELGKYHSPIVKFLTIDPSSGKVIKSEHSHWLECDR
jgi:hypothetical protein